MERNQKFYVVCKQCNDIKVFNNADEAEKFFIDNHGRSCNKCSQRYIIYGEDKQTTYAYRGRVLCDKQPLKEQINVNAVENFDYNSIEIHIGSCVVLKNMVLGYVEKITDTGEYEIFISELYTTENITKADYENHFERFYLIDNYVFGNVMNSKEKNKLFGTKLYYENKRTQLMEQLQNDDTLDKNQKLEIKKQIELYGHAISKIYNAMLRYKTLRDNNKNSN